MIERITTSQEETVELGRGLGRQLVPGDVILLVGDMGSGKTHLVKGIADSLGVTDYVTSPTFTILNVYRGRNVLNHFDVYRVHDEEELLNIGFDEAVFSEDISIIEWADLIPGLLPEKYLLVRMEAVSENWRRIHLDTERFHDIDEEKLI